QAPDRAVRELDRCVTQLGLLGVEIGSHVNDWNLSEPALFPVFARAEELGAAVFVHPWDMMGEARMRKYWLPWLVGMPAEGSLAESSDRTASRWAATIPFPWAKSVPAA